MKKALMAATLAATAGMTSGTWAACTADIDMGGNSLLNAVIAPTVAPTVANPADWQTMKMVCRNMNTDYTTNWRMPTLKEFRAICQNAGGFNSGDCNSDQYLWMDDVVGWSTAKSNLNVIAFKPSTGHVRPTTATSTRVQVALCVN